MRRIDLIRCVDNNNNNDDDDGGDDDDDDTADNVQVICSLRVVIVAVDLTMCQNFIITLASHARQNSQNKRNI